MIKNNQKQSKTHIGTSPNLIASHWHLRHLKSQVTERRCTEDDIPTNRLHGGAKGMNAQSWVLSMQMGENE